MPEATPPTEPVPFQKKIEGMAKDWSSKRRKAAVTFGEEGVKAGLENISLLDDIVSTTVDEMLAQKNSSYTLDAFHQTLNLLSSTDYGLPPRVKTIFYEKVIEDLANRFSPPSTTSDSK